MTKNQKRKLKRQAHKDFRKQTIQAYRQLADSCDELMLIRLTDTGIKKLKHVHHSYLLRINRLHHKTYEFDEIASRDYEEFYG